MVLRAKRSYKCQTTSIDTVSTLRHHLGKDYGRNWAKPASKKSSLDTEKEWEWMGPRRDGRAPPSVRIHGEIESAESMWWMTRGRLKEGKMRRGSRREMGIKTPPMTPSPLSYRHYRISVERISTHKKCRKMNESTRWFEGNGKGEESDCWTERLTHIGDGKKDGRRRLRSGLEEFLQYLSSISWES